MLFQCKQLFLYVIKSLIKWIGSVYTKQAVSLILIGLFKVLTWV